MDVMSIALASSDSNGPETTRATSGSDIMMAAVPSA